MNKIEAIKQVRAATGLGLKESKDLVEALIPTLQMDRAEIESELERTRSAINDFQRYIWAGMTLDEAKRLSTLIETRDRLASRL